MYLHNKLALRWMIITIIIWHKYFKVLYKYLSLSHAYNQNVHWNILSWSFGQFYKFSFRIMIYLGRLPRWKHTIQSPTRFALFWEEKSPELGILVTSPHTVGWHMRGNGTNLLVCFWKTANWVELWNEINLTVQLTNRAHIIHRLSSSSFSHR